MLFRNLLIKNYLMTYKPMSAVVRSVLHTLECQAAVCQMTSTHFKCHNYRIVKDLVSKAKSKGAVIVFLPEGCDFIANDKDEALALSEAIDGPTMIKYCALASQHQLWLSIGGFHEKVSNENKMYITHVIINSNGDIVSKYRKLHLFNLDIPEEDIHMHESDAVVAGDHLIQPVKTPIGLIGLGICYDLRFPEMSTILRKSGANILTYPSAFTRTTGEFHWETLLRARAIETQCYVIAAAQIGKHNDNRSSHGGATIIDPFGRIVSQCSTYHGDERDPQICYGYISPTVLNTVRTQIPVFQHRRDDIYTLTCHKIVEKCDESTEPKFMFANNEIPKNTVFLESAYSFAFTNIRCVVPGHVLVATKRIVKRLPDLDSPEISDLFQTVVKVQKAVEKAYDCNSSTIVVQDGAHAGQTVEHVHVHVLPRKEGDFNRNDDIYDALSKHDKPDSEAPRRSDVIMESEAHMIKRFIAM